jgi:hypothetical protein
MRLRGTRLQAIAQQSGFSDPLYRAAGQLPAFDLRFESGSIIDVIGGITPAFTRPSSTKLAWGGTTLQTFAADVPAFQVDPVTGRRGYLHEPAATNLFLDSATPATQGITVAAQVHTLSFYGTGTITLSGASTAGPLVGTGAEPDRVSLTFTPSAGTLTLTVSGSISRPQLETGTVATSPIITAGSAVTRAADTMTVSGANLNSWYNQLGGAVYWEGVTQTNAAHGLVGFDDTTSTERWRLGHNGTSALSLVVIDNNVNQTVGMSTPGGQAPTGAIVRGAASVALNDCSLSANGNALTTDVSVTVPTVTRMTIGTAQSTATMTGPIYRLAYFPPGPAQSRIQQMTA